MARKRRRDPNVLEGVMLQDRKVKRGWTESTDTKVKKNRASKDKAPLSSSSSRDQAKREEKKTKGRVKSKYTDQDECLLKTRLPPNAVGNLPAHQTTKKKKKKGGKNGSSAREVTVHEFERTTTFPGFLRHVVPERQGKPAVEFVDGRGWVDEDGNLVEAAVAAVKRRGPAGKTTTPKAQDENGDGSDSPSSTSSSGTSSEEDDSDSELAPKHAATTSPSPSPSQNRRNDAPLSPSSPSNDHHQQQKQRQQQQQQQQQQKQQQDPRPQSSSSARSLTIKIPHPNTTTTTTTTITTTTKPTTTTPPPKIHPLEALYKPAAAAAAAPPIPNPKTPFPSQSSTSAPAPAQPFTFFATDAADDDDPSQALSAPMTPFTRQDFEHRNLRSAAPTPDTAHPTSRGGSFWAGGAEEEEQEQEQEEQEDDLVGDVVPRLDGQQQGGDDFQSWFWDNRRDLNRAWMTRRKSAAKEKRHRENKSRASRAI
ncbi:hypothetical protein E4U41_007356 [Claviceps citrina]|nr:hypothetical protein E4U41_007356 [Claviceps citrina]